MKQLLLTLSLSLILMPTSSMAVPAPGMSGEELFSFDKWSSTGRSCAGCHPEGKGLESIGDFDDMMLKDIINACIRDALKAPMLVEDATELTNLKNYIRSLNQK